MSCFSSTHVLSILCFLKPIYLHHAKMQQIYWLFWPIMGMRFKWYVYGFHYQCWLVLGYEVHIIYWFWLVKANFKLWGAYIILILINIGQFWVISLFFFVKFKVACLRATQFVFQFLWCSESGIGWTLKPYFSYPKMTKIRHSKKPWHSNPIWMLSWKTPLNKLLVCGHIHIIQF